MVFCHNCGTENEDNAVLCSKCHKKLHYTKTNWEVKFVAMIVIIALGLILYPLFGLLGFYDDMIYTPVVSGENISAYKSSCVEIDLNKPECDLTLLSGQKVKIKGKFIGILDGYSPERTIFMIKAANLTYYPYIDVTYSSKVSYNEGEELEVYGLYDSFISYDNITVPLIKGAYIEKI